MAITKLLSGLPARTMAQDAFDAATAQLMTDLPIWAGEVNATAAAVNAIAAGGAYAIPYTFSTTTTDADPGAGTLRLSSATQNASTVIRIDLTGSDASTWTSVIDTFDDSTSTVKGHILLQKLGDATKWLLFSVASLASPSGYKNITVANVASSAASPFANGDSLILKFSRTGDKGEVGAPGMLLLATLTPTAAANVDALSTFTSSYDNYLICGTGILPAADDTLRVRFANAGTVDSGSNYFFRAVESATAVTTAATSGIAHSNNTTSAGKGLNFALHISNANDAANIKSSTGKAAYQTNATPGYIMEGAHFVYSAANAVSGVRFFWDGGVNFAAAGKIRIYGYNNA